MASTDPPANSLGLDFDQLKIQDTEPQASPEVPPSQTAAEPPAERKKPYVNPERVKTGGNQRDKLSEEALSERMARMREQNEKIKQRRLDVQADEEAFQKTQESERAKLAQSRKVQEGVDRTREQNAKRKLDKMQSREWDSMKAGQASNRQPPKTDTIDEKVAKEETATSSAPSPPPSADSGGWVRGGGPRGSSSPRQNRGRGRGRGRGGAPASGGAETPASAPAAPAAVAAAAPSTPTGESS